MLVSARHHIFVQLQNILQFVFLKISCDWTSSVLCTIGFACLWKINYLQNVYNKLFKYDIVLVYQQSNFKIKNKIL